MNGNKCAFLEPLEATATGFYSAVCRSIWDYIEGVHTKESASQNVRGEMFRLEKFILWHYQFGSKYDTPFWKHAKSLPFKPDDRFNYMLETCKKMSLLEIEKLWQSGEDGNHQYGQWSYPSFRCWVDGTKMQRYGPFFDYSNSPRLSKPLSTNGKGFGA